MPSDPTDATVHPLVLSSLTGRLAVWSARHGRLVLGVWLAVFVVAVFLALQIGAVVSAGEMTLLGRPESVRGQELLNEAFGSAEGEQETIVVSTENGTTVDDPAYQQFLQVLTADLVAARDVVVEAYSYPLVAAFDPESANALVSADRQSTLVQVSLRGDGAQAEGGPAGPDGQERLAEILDSHRTPAFTLTMIGDGSVGETFMTIAEEDLIRAELVGLPAAMGVLVLVFGALLAAGLSLGLAAVSIVTAIGLAALIGRVFDLSFFVVNMISMIGLAVGIDYALLIIERYREERNAGRASLEAIGVTGATASRAVLFSGVTVILALLGLFLVPITTFRSLGLGATLVVGVGVVAMLTLVPAALGLLGNRIDWLSLNRLRRSPRPAAKPDPRGERADEGGQKAPGQPYSGFWGRTAHWVMVRPVVSVILAGGVLLLLAQPFLQLERGAAGAETLPPGEARDAYQLLEEDFSAGALSPVEVALRPANAEARSAIERLPASLAAVPGFSQPRLEWAGSGEVARLTLYLEARPNSEQARLAVEDLRQETLPAALAGSAVEAYVTGKTAAEVDSFAVIGSYTPWVFAFVLGLSFLLLLVVFRSVVVPLKAIFMNLLSVGAAYGVLVMVFQRGWGAELLGFQRTPAVEAWVPLFLFCILFGLSMDYHVFLLSRIREHFDRTGRNQESVAVGLRATGRIITGAAAIMVVVFGTFASGRLVMMQQVGFGLAVAVFLDATLVRSVLVPATMALLGDINWYLPRWLRWLPDLRPEALVLPRVAVPALEAGSGVRATAAEGE